MDLDPDIFIALQANAFPVFIFFSLLSFLWGACIGSFLNVCIYRIPLEQSVVKPRSHCPQCNKLIPWYLNIPLLSWCMLRGRCRFCGTKIAARYVLVEGLVAVLFLLVWLKLAVHPPLGIVPMYDWMLVPVYWLAISGLVLGTFVDLDHLIIPDRVTLGGIVAGLVLSAAVPAMHGQEAHLRGLLMSAIGAAVGWGLLWLVAILGKLIFRKDAMGFGDVKLMGAIGAFMGWEGVLFTVVASSFLGSIVGITLVLRGRKGMQSRIPFGPYLALAAILWMFWGPVIFEAYVSLMTPMPPMPGG